MQPLRSPASPLTALCWSASTTGHPDTYMGGSFAVRVSLCEARVELPRVAILHHPSAKTNTTTEPSANNLRTIGSRCPLWWFAWKKLVSRCVEFTPRRGTRGDEFCMNQRMARSSKVDLPKCLVGEASTRG